MGRCNYFYPGVSTTEALTKMCEGNPGALNVLIQLVKPQNEQGEDLKEKEQKENIFALVQLDRARIYGPKIWMLYKDVFKQDIFRLKQCLLDGSLRQAIKKWETDYHPHKFFETEDEYRHLDLESTPWEFA